MNEKQIFWELDVSIKKPETDVYRQEGKCFIYMYADGKPVRREDLVKYGLTEEQAWLKAEDGYRNMHMMVSNHPVRIKNNSGKEGLIFLYKLKSTGRSPYGFLAYKYWREQCIRVADVKNVRISITGKQEIFLSDADKDIFITGTEAELIFSETI